MHEDFVYFGEITDKDFLPLKDKYNAFCNSITCAKKESVAMVRKNVGRNAIYCPDCGCALYWSKRDERHFRTQGTYED